MRKIALFFFILAIAVSAFFVSYTARTQAHEARVQLLIDAEVAHDASSVENTRVLTAQLLAERSPFFPLDGTNPEALEKAVEALWSAERESTYRFGHAPLIRSSRYPLQFLRQLPHLQRAREAFLLNPTSESLRQYEREIERTGRLYIRATARFVDTHLPLPTFANYRGVITVESEKNAASSLYRSSLAIMDDIAKRKDCLTRNPMPCEDEITLTMPSLDTALPTAEAVAISREIRSILAQATRPTLANESIVFITDSACLELGVHPFLLDINGNGRHSLPVRYVGALHFQQVQENAAPIDRWSQYYLSHEIPYVSFGATSFYQCPDFGSDVAKALTIQEISAVTRTDGTSTDVVFDATANTDLVAMLLANDTGQRKELIRLAVMYRENSAGFEHVVQSIADVHTTLIELITENAVDENALRPRSSIYDATFPLLLGHIPSVNRANASLYASYADTFRKRIFSWTPGSDLLSRAQALHYVQFVFDLHQK